MECDPNDNEEVNIRMEEALLAPISIYAAKCVNFADFFIGSLAMAATPGNSQDPALVAKFFVKIVLYWVQHADLTVAINFREDLVMALDLIKEGQIKIENEEVVARLKKVVSQPAVEYWKGMSDEKLQTLAKTFQIPKDASEYHQNEGLFKNLFLKQHLFQLLKKSGIFPHGTWQEKMHVLNKLSPYLAGKDLPSLVSKPAQPGNYCIGFDEDIFFGFNVSHLLSILKNNNLEFNLKIKAFKEALDFMKQFGKQPDYRHLGGIFGELDLSEQDVEVILLSLSYQGINHFLAELVRSKNKARIQVGFKKFLRIRQGHEIDQRHPGSMALVLKDIKDLDVAMAIYESAGTEDTKKEVKKFFLEGIKHDMAVHKTSLSADDLKVLSQVLGDDKK